MRTPSTVSRGSFSGGRSGSFGRSPTVAFGGRSLGGRGRVAAPSGEITRGWDHGHVHSWNHHHFRWYNGGWIGFDDGFDYPYGGFSYPYGYDNYDSSDNGYDNGTPDSAYAPPVVPDDNQVDSIGSDVQEALADAGYYRGAVDGEVGPQTRNAIAAFQRDHGLPVNGMINHQLLDAVGIR
jgi:Putative peptidoglycan binding domain